MRIFHIHADKFTELQSLPEALPAQGFLWVGSARTQFETKQVEVQAALQRWTGGSLVDLHVADLLNNQLPSHFDYTSWYDLMVFRRLTTSVNSPASTEPEAGAKGKTAAAAARQALASIDTSPVGFALFDHVLVTVHPNDCAVREFFAQRMSGLSQGTEQRGAARLPTSSAELMLRMLNHMVDSYLDLRRLMTKQLGLLQQQLLDPKSRFNDWGVLLESRNTMHLLEDTCEDQRSAVQEWIDALDEWPEETESEKKRERELLRVRSRDVQEHIERVLSHVRRLEQSAETAVQMHFSALGNRTNDIMRTLTVLTAVFMPLNLITGFFGMNFEALPLIHSRTGFWVAFGSMVLIFLVLVAFFRRKRYLGGGR
jgi:magnesium transporter